MGYELTTDRLEVRHYLLRHTAPIGSSIKEEVHFKDMDRGDSYLPPWNFICEGLMKLHRKLPCMTFCKNTTRQFNNIMIDFALKMSFYYTCFNITGDATQ